MRQQADQMFAECRIPQLLAKHGQVQLFGSYEYDLMAWPELDFWIVNSQFQPANVGDIIRDLSQAVSPTLIFVANQIEHAFGMTPPDALILDYRFIHREIHWKLDICISRSPPHANLFTLIRLIRETLTPTTHAIIKTIKTRVVESPHYLKSRWGFTGAEGHFSSYHIYTGVLRDGVSTPEEFGEYLFQQRGIDLRAELSAPELK